MYELPCHGSVLNKILMIGYMDIVIMLGSDDGCLSTSITSIGVKYRR